MSRNKNVLYLSYTGLTDPLGQSQVLAYLKELSRSKGYKFFVISFEKEKAYQLSSSVVKEICAEAGINWYPLSYTSKPPVLSTIRDVRNLRKKAKEILKENDIGLIHCRSYIASLIGLEIKRQEAIPFLFDMRGFWADERIDGGIWKLSNPVFRFIYRYFKRKEKDFIRESDHIVSLTENGKQEIMKWDPGIAPGKITVIPCCTDLEFFDPGKIKEQDQDKARAHLQIPGDAKIFSYLGTLGTWYMLDEMMDFAATCMQMFPGYYFLIISGEPASLALEAAKKAGIDPRFIKVVKLPRSQVPVYLSLSKFSLFFIKPAYSKKASSPVKQGELMSMGIPVVCNDDIGDTSFIVNESNSGVVINQFNIEEYRKAIEKIHNKDFSPGKIRENAKNYFMLSKGVESYAGIYNRLLNEN